MSIYSVACDMQADKELVLVENQDYVEDRLIALCDEIESAGVQDIEIASGLIFTLHYLLCKHDNHEAQKYYKALSKQFRQQMEVMHEYYELTDIS